uniref:Secreted protein n=1 Tax=Parascaris equorum TaxID=6256 RepID=A0A914RWM5_PAREQ
MTKFRSSRVSLAIIARLAVSIFAIQANPITRKFRCCRCRFREFILSFRYNYFFVILGAAEYSAGRLVQ